MASNIFGRLTKQTLSLLYVELNKPYNKQKLSNIIETLLKTALSYLTPYLYAIMAILVILFLMNCFQFMHYTRIVMQLHKFYELPLNISM